MATAGGECVRVKGGTLELSPFWFAVRRLNLACCASFALYLNEEEAFGSSLRQRTVRQRREGRLSWKTVMESSRMLPYIHRCGRVPLWSFLFVSCLYLLAFDDTRAAVLRSPLVTRRHPQHGTHTSVKE